MSRTELAGRSALSKAAISALTRDLVEHGMLVSVETVRGQGRPSIRLGLAAESAYFIGVSLVEAPISIVLTDMRGAVLGRRQIESANSPTAIGQQISRALPDLLAPRHGAPERLAGIGIAVPGYVDATQRICLQSTLLGWQDLPAAALIEAETGVPTAIENDARAVALSEKLFGNVRDGRSFSLVSVGDGIGCAHVVDGRLHRGFHGGAGEIAHATIEPDGAPCRCGKRGCLDTIASLTAIRAAARACGLPEDVAVLERLAGGGNADAISILHRAGAALGLAIAQLIQIIDPERVVITHLRGALDGLYGTVTRAAVDANVLPRLAGQIDVRFESAPRDFWARGAASIAADKFLSNPVFARSFPPEEAA